MPEFAVASKMAPKVRGWHEQGILVSFIFTVTKSSKTTKIFLSIPSERYGNPPKGIPPVAKVRCLSTDREKHPRGEAQG